MLRATVPISLQRVTFSWNVWNLGTGRLRYRRSESFEFFFFYSFTDYKKFIVSYLVYVCFMSKQLNNVGNEFIKHSSHPLYTTATCQSIFSRPHLHISPVRVVRQASSRIRWTFSTTGTEASRGFRISHSVNDTP